MNQYSNELEFLARKKTIKNNARYFQEEEIGMVHWDNNSAVTIRNNGNIDIFSESSTGLRIDPSGQSINSFSSRFNIFSNRTYIRTDPEGLVWNGWQLNPAFYEWCKRAPYTKKFVSPRNFTVKCNYQWWDDEEEKWKEREVLLPPFIEDKHKEMYEQEVQNILQNMGGEK